MLVREASRRRLELLGFRLAIRLMQPHLYGLLQFAREGSREERHNGKSDENFRLIIAAAIVLIGAKIAIEALDKKLGRGNGLSR